MDIAASKNALEESGIDLNKQQSEQRVTADSGADTFDNVFLFQSEPRTLETDANKDNSNNYNIIRDDTTYNMEQFEKNYMIIFNNYTRVSSLESRHRFEQDSQRLKDTFQRINFEVKEEADLTKDSILKKMNEFKTSDYSVYGCVAVVIMTLGDVNGELYTTENETYYESDILECFENANQTLSSKPKLIIFQTFRFLNEVSSDANRFSFNILPEKERSCLPIESDILVVRSTYYVDNADVSKSNFHEGTWFIQTLCEKINLCAAGEEIYAREQQEFMYIIRNVFRDVEIKIKELYSEENAIRNQRPFTTSTLIRELYFFKPVMGMIIQHDSLLSHDEVQSDVVSYPIKEDLDESEDEMFLKIVGSRYKKMKPENRNAAQIMILKSIFSIESNASKMKNELNWLYYFEYMIWDTIKIIILIFLFLMVIWLLLQDLQEIISWIYIGHSQDEPASSSHYRPHTYTHN